MTRMLRCARAGVSVFFLFASATLFSPPLSAHGFLPDEIPMAAGTALRKPGELSAITLTFHGVWQPNSLHVKQGEAHQLVLRNRSDDWHLFALGDDTALHDQDQIHRLMPDLKKDYPNTRYSQAGSTTMLPWRFDKVGTFRLRCVRSEHQGNEDAWIVTVSGDTADNALSFAAP